ncbi:MAG: HlyD family secretion protein [Gemmatimonadaceae bacterium]
MDIARDPPKKRKKYIYAAVGVAAVALVTVALGRLEPAAPSVERATLWVDTVERGTMVRQVRAPGTLVPEQIRWIPAVTGGRIEQIHVRPGTAVEPQTVLLEMTNPDVQLEALAAQQQLTSAEAALITLRTALEAQRLNQKATVATVRADYEEAKRQAEMMESLDEKGLATAMEVGRARGSLEELSTRLEVEQERLDIISGSMEEQIALQQAQVQRLRAIAQFQAERIASMKVTAGAAGVVQEMELEVGQWVNPGALLTKVAQPGNLKAELRVPETQAKDVVVGLPVDIDTRNGIIAGHVIRIDPSAQNGTVGVDVSLDGELPAGARPDLSVDGTIEIERLEDVLYVGRPAYGQAESTVGIFRLGPEGDNATRVNVKLGRASVNTIEVQQGLEAGDAVIISDMSAWDNVDRVRLR